MLHPDFLTAALRWCARCVALWVFAIAIAADEPPQLRLMTYNIRLDVASDGANAWPHRRAWVIQQVHWMRPDVFGLQEVRPNQYAELAADLPRYRLIGEGRDGKGEGEASPLGFDAQRFELLDSGTFWLSPTPDTPSPGWDAAHNRVVTWARLKLREPPGGPVVVALNTHWDHIGMHARAESARLVVQWLESHARECEHVIVLGDFNTGLDTVPLRAMRDAGLRDAREASRSAPFGPSGTFNGFKNPAVDPRVIDHIFVGEGIAVERYLVLAQQVGPRWPSDHFPVLADVTLPPCRR